MLVQFDVGNYKSFKDVVSFSMVASPLKEHYDTHIFDAPGKLKLLKSSVLYGANASGKSNLFAAMRFMRDFVLESSKDMNAQDKISTDTFRLCSETEKKPSYFQMIFIKDGIRYRYGFKVTTTEVISEWLFHTTRVKNEVALFEREGKKVTLGKTFKEGNSLDEKTRKNALFLSVVAQFNGKTAEKILDWFLDLRIISGLNGNLPKHVSTNLLEDLRDNEENVGAFKKMFIKFLKRADLGIVDVNLREKPFDFNEFPPELRTIINETKVKIPEQQTVVSISHDYYNENQERIGLKEFDLEKEESQGTKKLYGLLGPIVYARAFNIVLVVDELDSSLHPLISRLIVSLFHSNDNINAQLIFNTHDTNLLNKKYLRRDQIWFSEKDSYGATDIYSLADFNVRNDASFEKDYLLGKYGSIPYIGNFEFDCCGKGELVGN